MQAAIAQAKKAQSLGEVPVGAVIVKDGKIIARGYNRPIKNYDPSAHAEIVAIRAAGKKIKNYRLTDCEIYVTIEPCAMCRDAIRQARIKKIIYGADDADIAKKQKRRIETTSGVLKNECSSLIKNFFASKRK